MSKVFGAPRKNAVTALDVVNAEIKTEEIVCLLGPSGCGKSTLLDVIAGFEEPSSGTVSVGGRVVTRPGPDRAMVFQAPALFPWFNVRKNVILGASVAECRKSYEDGASKYLDAVGLRGFQRHYPYQLSGGMRQRASIARALLGNPTCCYWTSRSVRSMHKRGYPCRNCCFQVWDRFRPTIVFVTHDVEEAVFLRQTACS